MRANREGIFRAV